MQIAILVFAILVFLTQDICIFGISLLLIQSGSIFLAIVGYTGFLVVGILTLLIICLTAAVIIKIKDNEIGIK